MNIVIHALMLAGWLLKAIEKSVFTKDVKNLAFLDIDFSSQFCEYIPPFVYFDECIYTSTGFLALTY